MPLLYFVTAFFMVFTAYADLLGVAEDAGEVNFALLIQQWQDALELASALLLLVAAAIYLRNPRAAAAIALLSSIAALPHFFVVSYYAFYAALILICILPVFYLLIWMPLALVLVTAIVSIRTLLSKHLETA